MFEDLEEKPAKGFNDRELISQIAYLAIEAYRREEISRGRLLEISKTLKIEGRQLLELAEAAKDN